jgi:hypothetical protein
VIADLFPHAPPSVIVWQGHPGPFGRNCRWTSQQLPGVVVAHCGHPTALRPYYIVGELATRGTFPRLADAQARAVEVYASKGDA